jgi:hypothetical protein
MNIKNISLRTQVIFGYFNPLQPLIDSIEDCIRGTDAHGHKHNNLKHNFHWLMRHPFRALSASWNHADGFKKGALVAGSPLAFLAWGTKVLSNSTDKAFNANALTNVKDDIMSGFKNRKSNNIELIGILSALACYTAGSVAIAITAATGVGIPVAMSVGIMTTVGSVACLMATGLIQETADRYQTFKQNQEGPAIQNLFEQYGIWSDQEDIGDKLREEMSFD